MNNNPIHYITLHDHAGGSFTLPSGSLILQAIHVFNELRIYYLSEGDSLLPATFDYQIVGTGKKPRFGMSHLLTYCDDGLHVWHLFVEDEALVNPLSVNMERLKETIEHTFSTINLLNDPVEEQEKQLATTISEDEHKTLSFIYRKVDGTTRLMRLCNVAFGVINNRQVVSGLDAEKNYDYRQVYLDMIEEWVGVK